MKKPLWFVLCLLLFLTAKGQIFVHDYNIRSLVFAPYQHQFHFPEVTGGNQAICDSINTILHSYYAFPDDSFVINEYAEREIDSADSCHYEIIFQDEKNLVLHIHSELRFEPHPQDNYYWFDLRNGSLLTADYVVNIKGLLSIRDSVKQTNQRFEKSLSRKAKKEAKEKGYFEMSRAENTLDNIYSFYLRKDGLHVNYRCNYSGACDLYEGPEAEYIIPTAIAKTLLSQKYAELIP